MTSNQDNLSSDKKYDDKYFKELYDQFIEVLENVWMRGLRQIYSDKIKTPTFENIKNSYHNRTFLPLLFIENCGAYACSFEIIDERDDKSWHPILIVYFSHQGAAAYDAKRTFRLKHSDEQFIEKEFEPLYKFISETNIKLFTKK